MPENDNNNFWNALLTAGASMWAQNKKKKEDNNQLEFMNSLLESKRQYENEKIDRYKSSPAAQMSPMIMEMLVGAYGPKFKKYGIDMPLDRMLAAINGGGSGTQGGSGAPEGTSGSTGASQPKRSLSEIANDKPAARTVSDMIAAQLGRRDDYSAKTGVVAIGGPKNSEWDNPAASMRGSQNGGASAGSLGSREDTRKDYGSGDWGTIGGNKVFVGTGATGNKLAYEKPTTNVTQWKDNKIENGDFEGQPFAQEHSQSASPEDVMGGDASAGLDKDTVFEKLSRFLDKEGFLPSMVRGLGNAFMPGGPGALDSALEFGINRGIGDGVKGNAGITKISNRTGPRKRGGSWN